ncbi:MAG: beta-ketoacyl-[acyl-carrier-protein] synthase family protein [Sphaerobacter sp.]|nr:beta-ketoacyl-[acyl-carrier-protein] synthase family protein [Sphaerobacter sp.]
MSRTGHSRRVVVTGIGAITPIGCGRQGLWDGLRRGRPATRTVTRFDPAPFRSQVAAEIDGFVATDHMRAERARRSDRCSQLAVAAGRLAITDAGLAGSTAPGLRRAGVLLGSALGGVPFAEEQHARFLRAGLRAVEPALALTVFGGAPAANVAIELGLTGPILGNANSCASGAVAIGEAARAIRDGIVDVALAGGAEAPLTPLTFGAFDLIRALSTRNADPATASRPFDRDRDGFVMAEGSVILVLEELGHAERRGACPYAEILGYGATNDAYHMVRPLPSGHQAARAMLLALREAARAPREVEYVNAHATATPLGDAAETRALHHVFGTRPVQPAVSGTKGLYGHPLGASGAIEVALTALILAHGWLPPTTNLIAPDPACALRHVPPGGCAAPVRLALTNSFGFGGINACLVLARWEA